MNHFNLIHHNGNTSLILHIESSVLLNSEDLKFEFQDV